MKKATIYCVLAGLILIAGCTSEGINYSKSLFRHIPDNPDLLVLVKPNDLAKLSEMAVNELPVAKFMEGLSFDAEQVRTFQTMAVAALEAVGVPWEKVTSVGFLVYFGQVTLLVSGEFGQEVVSARMDEIGFKKESSGYHQYIYNDWKASIPEDGLMMFAPEELLDDLAVIPDENRLWNRPDFKEYRSRSPLDNSLFIWAHPGEDLLKDFKYHDDLGDVSLAVDFSGNLTMKATVRIKDPEKTVLLHDIIFGSVTVAGGFFGDDADYGPMFKAIKVTHDNKQVETSLVLSSDQLQKLKERVKDDFNNPDSKTMEKLRSTMDLFR